MKPALFLALSLFVTVSCSGGDDNPDVSVEIDAAPIDAAPIPDAEVCQMTECGSLCVDTSSNSLHCGGCDMACDSPGQICSGALPCECPADFIPQELTGSIMAQGPALIGFSPIISETFDIGAVIYDLNVATGVEHTLGGLAFPAVLAGYDTDLSTQMAHTAYAGTSGTIIFDTLCAEGASGTIPSIVFEEVEGIMNPTPIAGGCTMSYTNLSFAFGTCPTGPDAGVMDAGVEDAGVPMSDGGIGTDGGFSFSDGGFMFPNDGGFSFPNDGGFMFPNDGGFSFPNDGGFMFPNDGGFNL